MKNKSKPGRKNTKSKKVKAAVFIMDKWVKPL